MGAMAAPCCWRWNGGEGIPATLDPGFRREDALSHGWPSPKTVMLYLFQHPVGSSQAAARYERCGMHHLRASATSARTLATIRFARRRRGAEKDGRNGCRVLLALEWWRRRASDPRSRPSPIRRVVVAHCRKGAWRAAFGRTMPCPATDATSHLVMLNLFQHPVSSARAAARDARAARALHLCMNPNC